ncbi:ATP-binding protein [Thermopirellula anaerolimosa]
MELRVSNLEDLVRTVDVPGLTVGRNPGTDRLIEEGGRTVWLVVDESSGARVSGPGWSEHFSSRHTETLIEQASQGLRDRGAWSVRVPGLKATMDVLAARLDVGRSVIMSAARPVSPDRPPPADEPAIITRLTTAMAACLLHGETLFQELRTRVEHQAAEQEMLRLARGETFIGTVTEREERIRQQRERELWEKLCREAESANRAKNEFLSNISHELRTPLTAILGYTDMLAEEADPEARSRHLEVIRRQSRALLTLVDDILELSVLDRGKLRIEKSKCRPWRIVDEILEWARPQAESRGLTIRAEYAFPIPSLITTDARLVRQILLHLVGNAVKFTERGEIVLGLSWLKKVGGRSQIRFFVRDTGPGIPPDDLARLFEPFHQLDGTSTRRHGGLGLGLTLAQRLVHALGGTLEVSSRLGEGSTFTVSLDAELLPGVELIHRLPEESSAPQASTPTAEPVARLEPSEDVAEVPRGRILLVEDSPENRRLIGRFLHLAGWEPETAENGLEGWQAAIQSLNEGRPFDLILMDMQMPVMDGYEACARLRQAGWRGPIVAVTAHALPEDREKCLQAGCDDYLTKPIRRDVLVETVRRYLSLSHAEVADSTA